MTVNYMGKKLDTEKLFCKDCVKFFLSKNGGTYSALGDMRTQYEKSIGFDVVWRYPLEDGVHSLSYIIPVKEGFLWIPVDEIDSEDYEILLLDNVGLLSSEDIMCLMREYLSYSTELVSALTDMAVIRAEQEKSKMEVEV